jgi:hypothetical protein
MLLGFHRILSSLVEESDNRSAKGGVTVMMKKYYSLAGIFTAFLTIFVIFAFVAQMPLASGSFQFSNLSHEVRQFRGNGGILEGVKGVRDSDASGREAKLYGDSADGFFSSFCIGSYDANDDLKAALNHLSETDRKMNREAVTTSFRVMHHALKAYATEYLRSVTEGGKNAAGLSADVADWRKVLSRVLPS